MFYALSYALNRVWDVLSGVAEMAWDVLSEEAKMALDVLSGVANQCGMFCPGCQKMAWDVLSNILLYQLPRFGWKNFKVNRRISPDSTTFYFISTTLK